MGGIFLNQTDCVLKSSLHLSDPAIRRWLGVPLDRGWLRYTRRKPRHGPWRDKAGRTAVGTGFHFVFADGRHKGAVSGGPVESGRCRLSGKTGPAVGWNQGRGFACERAARKFKPFASQGEMVEESVEAVAPRFNSESILRVEVKPGDNTADFAVESK